MVARCASGSILLSSKVGAADATTIVVRPATKTTKTAAGFLNRASIDRSIPSAIGQGLRLMHAILPSLRSVAVIPRALSVPVAAHARTLLWLRLIATAGVSTVLGIPPPAGVSATTATIVSGLRLVHASMPLLGLVTVEPGAFSLPGLACGGRSWDDHRHHELQNNYEPDEFSHAASPRLSPLCTPCIGWDRLRRQAQWLIRLNEG